MSRAQLLRQTEWRLTAAMLTANVTGAVVVFVFLYFLLPLAGAFGSAQRTANLVLFAGYLALSVLIGQVWGGRIALGWRSWLRSEAPADDLLRRSLLRVPLRQTGINATMWLGAAALFGALNAFYAPSTTLDISSTILLAGVATCGVSYLLLERYLRPVVTVAMSSTTEPPALLLGVRPRLVLAWALGSGIPLAGLLLGVTVPGGRHPPLGAGGVAFLAVVGLVVGSVAIVTAAGAVSDPVRSVADALREVGQGRLDVDVPVYDASEVGRLQSGFNAMMTGLRERERIRDLFGRQVGDDVARLALERGSELGGEVLDVAVLFVDVVGSTSLALTEHPQEVVRRLNEFFAVVIEVVQEHGGWVNKFEGDAALCVFGAPVELPAADSCALAAARALALRLDGLTVDAAIGVSGGPVVAGHIGAESRFEYTVIGDPVNAAARLTELAKTRGRKVLADAALLVSATAVEAEHWSTGGSVVLRGRVAPTWLAEPR